MNPTSMRLFRAVLWAVFGWSCVVWALAQTGLGGRYSLHPSDPENVAPLPELSLAKAQSQLASLPEYSVVADRPLFNPDRRPQVPESDAATDAATPAPVAAPLDVLLTSVVMAGKTQLAVVTDRASGKAQSVRLGDALAGDQAAWKLVELEPRAAVFEGPSGRSRVELRVFDGTGGEAPTPISVPAPPREEGDTKQDGAEAEQTPESRAEMIRKRIEERRRQMREEAARANQEKGQ